MISGLFAGRVGPLLRQRIGHNGSDYPPRTGLLFYSRSPNVILDFNWDEELDWDQQLLGYSLPETDAVRAATGWVSGTANFWFEAAGSAIKLNAAAILEWEGINKLNILFGARGLAVYALDALHTVLAKAREYLRIDPLAYWPPYLSILHFNADSGFSDLTGRQSVSLIGSEYPEVVSGYAINESGKEWQIDTDIGPVKEALAAGELTLVQVVKMPIMSSLADATDYSLFGDLLFVRRDGDSGVFKVSDSTNVASVSYNWSEGEVVTVVVKCFNDGVRHLMRVEVM